MENEQASSVKVCRIRYSGYSLVVAVADLADEIGAQPGDQVEVVLTLCQDNLPKSDADPGETITPKTASRICTLRRSGNAVVTAVTEIADAIGAERGDRVQTQLIPIKKRHRVCRKIINKCKSIELNKLLPTYQIAGNPREKGSVWQKEKKELLLIMSLLRCWQMLLDTIRSKRFFS